jgi:cell wall-associated NlpC family hydrolase
MLEKLKELWDSWKVQMSFVGGALVVSAIWGTCTYEPPAAEQEAQPASDVDQVEDAAATTTEADSEASNAATDATTSEENTGNNTATEATESENSTNE